MARTTSENKEDKQGENLVEPPVTTSENKEGVGVVVFNPKLAGKNVFGVKGIISFDKDGKALVEEIEAEHFAKVPGYEVTKK